jgi:hypothetical protein
LLRGTSSSLMRSAGIRLQDALIPFDLRWNVTFL